MVNDHIPPGMRRVLIRLGETPVAVFAADWRLVWWNRSWATLLASTRSRRSSSCAPAGTRLVTSHKRMIDSIYA
jgi:MmyB-like transcription regulator ligand binding domain